mmetsp:Transcript_19637/g.45926  ORF Transcript_19637/g.45926 Transcript_19637/m.45926 type:complete len:240 (-) Transcript_19637:1449-2168(-)
MPGEPSLENMVPWERRGRMGRAGEVEVGRLVGVPAEVLGRREFNVSKPDRGTGPADRRLRETLKSFPLRSIFPGISVFSHSTSPESWCRPWYIGLWQAWHLKRRERIAMFFSPCTLRFRSTESMLCCRRTISTLLAFLRTSSSKRVSVCTRSAAVLLPCNSANRAISASVMPLTSSWQYLTLAFASKAAISAFFLTRSSSVKCASISSSMSLVFWSICRTISSVWWLIDTMVCLSTCEV